MGFLDRVGLFFAVEVANCLYAFQEERGGVTAAGYAGDPSTLLWTGRGQASSTCS
jgi:hypothetical protein